MLVEKAKITPTCWPDELKDDIKGVNHGCSPRGQQFAETNMISWKYVVLATALVAVSPAFAGPCAPRVNTASAQAPEAGSPLATASAERVAQNLTPTTRQRDAQNLSPPTNAKVAQNLTPPANAQTAQNLTPP